MLKQLQYFHIPAVLQNPLQQRVSTFVHLSITRKNAWHNFLYGSKEIKSSVVSNIIFLLCVLTAITWSFCYVLLDTSPAIHIFLFVAFIGIAASIYLDERKEISNQQ